MTPTPDFLSFSECLPTPHEISWRCFDITCTRPVNFQLSVVAHQYDWSLELANSVGQYDLHTTTPETADTTHYFFATRRNHNEEDGEYNKAKIDAMHAAFENEDGPVIEAVHEEMGTTDFFSLNPVLGTNDIAPVKVRQLLQKLITKEQS